MRFRQFINEILDSNIAIQKVKGTGLQRVWRSTIGDRDIIFVASNLYHRNEWNIEFGEISSEIEEPGTFDIEYDLTKSGDEMKVFSMISKCIIELIKDTDPKAIIFSANKGDKNRARVYEQLIKRLRLHNYKLTVDDTSHAVSVLFKLEKV